MLWQFGQRCRCDMIRLFGPLVRFSSVRKTYQRSNTTSSVGLIGDKMNNKTSDTLIRDNLQDYSPASNLLHNEKIREMMAAGKEIYHFGFGQSPFPLMDHAVEALKKHAGKSSYLPVIGIPELRNEICKFHHQFDDISLSSDDVIVGPGSKELIFLLMNVFQGDIIVISPSWTTYKPQVLLSQHTPCIINTDFNSDWKITGKQLDQFLTEKNLSTTKLLIFNNPDNPTGTCYSEKDLLELSDACRKHNVIVLADEIYARIKYSHDHVSMAKVYPEGTILCSGFSKWAGAGGWRVGYHIYPKQLTVLREAVRSAASHTYTTVAAPIQYAVAEFVKDTDKCTDYMNHTTRIMELLGSFCHNEFKSVGVQSVKPKGGYYIFPDFEILRPCLQKRGIHSCEDMVNCMFEETSVSVMAGGPAFLRPNNELTTRLCFVNFDGKQALSESRKIGLSKPLPPNFVKEQCGPVYFGIQAIKTWMQKMLEER